MSDVTECFLKRLNPLGAFLIKPPNVEVEKVQIVLFVLESTFPTEKNCHL